MMTIGVDCHKRTHTAVALDELGRRCGTKTVRATPDGHFALARWAAQFGERRFALEDCRHVTSCLEVDLLAGGEEVRRVPPSLTGPSRRGQRSQGKSDPVDAEAVGRAALAHPDLPVATVLSEGLVSLRIVHMYRKQAVADRTVLINRLRWRLHAMDATYDQGSFTTYKHLRRAQAFIGGFGTDDADIASREIDRIWALTEEINQLYQRIEELIGALGTGLCDLPGVGPINAAELLTQIGDITRFTNPAKLAAYAGVAPIPASSGNTTRWRLNRGGNRQLNAAIHRTAISQLAHHQPAQDYTRRKISQGKTRKEAIRALKRHITTTIWRTLTNELT